MQFDLTIEQGADYRLELQIRNSEGTLVDLTGYTGRGQIRSRVGGPLAADFEVFITQNVIISLNHLVTSTLIPGNYSWDLILADSSGRRTKHISGIAKVHGTVTIWN